MEAQPLLTIPSKSFCHLVPHFCTSFLLGCCGSVGLKTSKMITGIIGNITNPMGRNFARLDHRVNINPIKVSNGRKAAVISFNKPASIPVVKKIVVNFDDSARPAGGDGLGGCFVQKGLVTAPGCFN
jgi:hypothetical protein